jgi:YD repeat-containing protein
VNARLILTFALPAAGIGSAATTYTYDRAERLILANYGSAAVVACAYDSAGNLISRKVQSAYPVFFNGQASVGNGVYYLQFPDSNLFGYYNLTNFPILYHYDMGFEAFIDGGNGAAYLYDFTSSHWFYTSSSLFSYLYDFTLNAWLYYFPDTNNAGHYTTNPRYFSNLSTGKIFTM